MKIDWHAGIILLFALSSLFFLGKALANKRSGKPFRWKIGNLLLIGMSSVTVVLLLAALLFMLLKNYNLMQWFISIGYVFSALCGVLFAPSKESSLSSVTAEQVRQAKYSMDTAQADMAAIKMSALEQITATLDKLNEQASAYQSNISEYRAKDGALLYDDSREISRQQIKNGYYIDISNSIVSLRQELKTLESQKLDAEETSANLSVSAARSGILLYSQNCAIGDVVSGGATIASIIPESGGYEIELYIPDGKISEVHVGQEIEYTFEAVSVTDFGKAQGKITDISADSFTNQTDGGKYYKATATIDNTVLTGDNGETRVLKIGMLTKAHAKTGTQSILSWLLDKLNLHIS